MQVTFNGRFLTRQMTGVDRVALNLIQHLDRIWPVEKLGRFTLAVPRAANAITLIHGDIVECGKQQNTRWEQWDLPRAFPESIIINLCNTAPLLHARNIVLIHDANVADFPVSYARRFRLWYRALLPLLSRRALRVATVSSHSADRLMANKITPRRPLVISNGCDHFDPALTASTLSERSNTILFVGSPARHKNLDLFLDLARRFATSDLTFKIAGATSNAVFASDHDTSPPPNVSFLGRVDEAQLVRLFQTSRALIFPSFVEGFGLTPLEAQQYGCPVISSNRQPMQETLEGSALFADPNTPQQWEDALNRILTEPGLWQSLSDAGRINAARFSWQTAAQDWLRLIIETRAAAMATAQTPLTEREELCPPSS